MRSLPVRLVLIFSMLVLLTATGHAQEGGGESRITAISSPMVMEGDAGTTTMTFVVTADCGLSVNAEVNWQLNDGTATTADNDYIDVTAGNPAPGIFVACSGATGLTNYNLDVQIVGDTNFEPDETLQLELTSASVGSPSFFIDVSTATGTIQNDDSEIVYVDIALTSTESIDPVVAGSGMNNLTQIVTVTNNGPATATGIEIGFSVTVVAGVTVESITPSEGMQAANVWSIPSLPSGDDATLTFVYTAGAGTPTQTDSISVTANVIAVNETDTQPGNDSTSINTSTLREVDIELTSTESIDPVVAGSGAGNLIHTITATNNGPSDSSGVAASATITFPAGVVVDLVDPSGSGSWSGTNPGTWTIGDLASGASETLTVTFTVDASAAVGTDVIDTSANVSAANETDTNPGNDTSQVATSVERQIDLTVTKTDDPDPVLAGLEIGGLTHTVTVTNNGPSDGTAVEITEAPAFPTGVSLESFVVSAGSFDGTIWTVDLPLGATETLDLIVTVGPDTVPGDDVISNTATATGSGGGEIIINTGDDSATETTSVLPITATWTVMKDFLDDSGASVTATLSCDSGTVITPPVSVSEGSPADLTVEGFLMGPFGTTTCEVTESDLPADYFQVSASADCAVDGVMHQDEFDCEFVNAPLSATFEVTKDFSDDNPAEVRVVIECNTGLPLMQEAMVSEFGMPFEKISFIVGDFELGELDCEIFEEPVPTGYTANYDAGFEDDALFGLVDSDENGCIYEEIQTGTYSCDIFNQLQPVDVIVNKEWIDENPQFALPTLVEIELTCNAPIVSACGESAEGTCGPAEGPGYDSEIVYIDPDNPGEFLVLPHWDGSTECSVTEELLPGVIPDTSDCDVIPLAPGQGGECTIVNTRFYEGIPTLSQYGLMLLSLLMLGMGALAFRRFA
ncbi:MAG TPA: IPTL-CTERM sorting domain-containing protein [Xanthomonadales bacterium]|nr:IPTL-CTERM sorting domain-containing protein [Xanthomonadales bacterium]